MDASLTGDSHIESAARFGSAELDKQLVHADRLLAYAAEVGKDIEKADRDAVLEAKAAPARWTPELADKFLAALTSIARKTQPVTGESLAACEASAKARAQTRYFVFWTWALAPVIVLFSICDFYVSKLCEQIQADLHTAQTLAVKLNDTLFYGTDEDQTRVPVKHYSFNQGEVITDLTQFAVLTRAINMHSGKLDRFTIGGAHTPYPDPQALELDPRLTELSSQAVEAIRRYQKVRQFAQSVRADATMLYGAMLQCVLPMMYAILGTLAFLLRRFDTELTQRSFRDRGMHTARFATAAIGGIVVGLFNVELAPGTTAAATQGASVSPLAIAFLVGYAVDMFFNLVETLAGAFTRSRT